MLDCHNGGSCFGGDSGILFDYAKNWKIPIETCNVFKAVSSYEAKCLDY